MNRLLACLIGLLVVCPLSLAGDPPAKAEIEKTLRTMSAAAMAGDRHAFMACLDTTNPWFKQEQTAWCDDVERHHPKEVVFTLGDDPAPEYGDDQTHATLHLAYTSEVGAAVDGTKAHWPAVFVRMNGRWLYAGADWKTLEGDRFVVRYMPGSEKVARMVVDAFPKSRAHDDEGFGVKPGPQQIELFRSMAHLKATVYLNQPDPVLMGWNEAGESIKFMDTYAKDVPGWTAAFAHEYGHVCTWEYGKKIKDAPWWVQEGVAELAAEEFIPGSREVLDHEMRELAATGKLVPWDKISDYDKAEQPVKMMAYHEGHHMLGFISERWGREGRWKWLRAMAAGKTVDHATRDVMGMSFSDLDKEWRTSLTGPRDKAKESPAESEEHAAVRAELVGVMHDMCAAAINADAETYLSHVYKGDKEFFNEQKYFAKDMHKKPPAEFEMEIGELTVGDGTVEGPLTMTWTMPEKKERSVSFKARFVKGDAGWQYAGETWEKHQGPGAEVLCDPGLDELAQRTLEAFLEVRDRVETGFELEDGALPKKIERIKLYGSMKHLQASICLSYENGLGGWNEPGEPIKLLTGEGTPKSQLRSVLAHEYGHVATFELGPKSNDMPWWILEGVADLSAERPGSKGPAAVERWAKVGQLAPWTELSDFETCKPQYQRYVYVQGHHMMGFISERWGRHGRNEWMKAMSNGATIDEASQKVMGMTFAQLDEAWRASLPPEEPKDAKTEEKKDAEK